MQTLVPFILTVALAVSLPSALKRFRVEPMTRVIAVYAIVTTIAVSTGATSRFVPFAIAAGVLACGLTIRAIISARTLKAHRLVSLGAPACFAYGCAWLLLRDVASGSSMDALPPLLLTLLVFSAIILLHAEGHSVSLAGFVALATTVAFLVNVSAIVSPDEAWRACRESKCSPVGGLYAGSLDHENSIGQIGAWLFLAALAARKSRARPLQLAVGLTLILLSGSRSALAATGGAIVGGLLLATAARRVRGAVGCSRPWAIAAAATPAVLSLALIARVSINDFSFRGRRWVALRDELGGTLSPIGLGSDAWSAIDASLGQPATSAHSTYGLLLVSGGLVSVFLFSLGIGVMIRAVTARSRRELAYQLMPVLFLSLMSLSEVTWNPMTFNERTWVVVALAGIATSWKSPAPVEPRTSDAAREI